jgi:hypothetical protein
MTFNSHPAIEGYLFELEKIIVVREQVEAQLVKALDVVAKTGTDFGINEEYVKANQRVKELGLELSTITSKGERLVYKIDQVNGVRR